MMPPASMSEATTKAVTLSTHIVIAAIVVLFFAVAFCFFLHLYAQCYWTSNNEDPNMSWSRQLARQRLASSAPARRRGLDNNMLLSLSVVVYDPKEFKDGLECAVCLSEVSEGEKARLLPKCNHGFHVECIDMWFQSHSTCPLCRNPVIPTPDCTDGNLVLQDDDGSYTSDSNSDSDSDGSYDSPNATEVPDFPTNVLFCGDETQVRTFGQAANAAASSSASSSGVRRPTEDEMVIEIPSHEMCIQCSSSPPPSEEAKTPVMSSLRSLGRLLSMGKRVAPSTSGSDQKV